MNGEGNTEYVVVMRAVAQGYALLPRVRRGDVPTFRSGRVGISWAISIHFSVVRNFVGLFDYFNAFNSYLR